MMKEVVFELDRTAYDGDRAEYGSLSGAFSFSVDPSFLDEEPPRRIELRMTGRNAPSPARIIELGRLAESGDRATAYRAQAELEDIADGHWDGPRTDDPPKSWRSVI
jgi:hypothetical protein